MAHCVWPWHSHALNCSFKQFTLICFPFCFCVSVRLSLSLQMAKKMQQKDNFTQHLSADRSKHNRGFNFVGVWHAHTQHTHTPLTHSDRRNEFTAMSKGKLQRAKIQTGDDRRAETRTKTQASLQRVSRRRRRRRRITSWRLASQCDCSCWRCEHN